MTTTALEVGQPVTITTTWGDSKRLGTKAGWYKRHGTIVEIGNGVNLGRVRVLWGEMTYDRSPARQDGKRTWVAIKSLDKV